MAPRVCIHCNVPAPLSKAVAVAARVKMVSSASYIRMALASALAGDGIDLERLDTKPEPPAKPVAEGDDPLNRILSIIEGVPA